MTPDDLIERLRKSNSPYQTANQLWALHNEAADALAALGVEVREKQEEIKRLKGNATVVKGEVSGPLDQIAPRGD